MIYYGMTPDPTLSAGMVLTESEKAKAKIFKRMPERPKRYANKGYLTDHLCKGRHTYRPYITLDKKQLFLGVFKDEGLAKMRHREAVDQFNNGTFDGWYEGLSGVKKQ